MQVQTEALNRAIKLLVAANCKFAIIDADGEQYGTLEVIQKTKKHRNHPPGTFLKYHRQFTENLKPGESITVPFGIFDNEEDRESLRSSISASCSRTWGPSTYITANTPKGIELLRVD